MGWDDSVSHINRSIACNIFVSKIGFVCKSLEYLLLFAAMFQALKEDHVEALFYTMLLAINNAIKQGLKTRNKTRLDFWLSATSQIRSECIISHESIISENAV